MRFLAPPADPATGRGRYVVAAWLLALVPSLAFLGLRVLTGHATLAAPAGPGALAFTAYSILLAPLLETAAMLPVGALLRQVWLRNDGPRIAVLALLAAVAHGVAGGFWAAAGAFWPFVVYAACLFAWWRHGWRRAFAITTMVHALYNASLFCIGFAAGRLASTGAIPP